VLPPKIFLKSARVAHFDEENQEEARKLDSNLLEERHNIALANMQKYQESLKKYYNKSVIQRELNIGDLVLKKDMRTKDKHTFSSPWECPFIIVKIVAPGLMYWQKLMAVCYATHGIPISYASIIYNIFI
jgi:hypothetical protein